MWQAWHLWHWAGFFGALGFRCDAGRRGFFDVAGVALGDIYLHFAWQAWHLWHWAGFGGALGFRYDAGRPGFFGVADVALGDIYLHFAWQAWHSVTPSLCVGGVAFIVGVALGDIHTDVYITFPTQLFLLLDPFHHLLCLSFLPRHNFCTHTHTYEIF